MQCCWFLAFSIGIKWLKLPSLIRSSYKSPHTQLISTLWLSQCKSWSNNIILWWEGLNEILPFLASRAAIIHERLAEQLVSWYGWRTHSRLTISAESAPHDWSTAHANHTALKHRACDANHSCATGSRIIYRPKTKNAVNMERCQTHRKCERLINSLGPWVFRSSEGIHGGLMS